MLTNFVEHCGVGRRCYDGQEEVLKLYLRSTRKDYSPEKGQGNNLEERSSKEWYQV